LIGYTRWIDLGISLLILFALKQKERLVLD
jgi:hypothetical protein